VHLGLNEQLHDAPITISARSYEDSFADLLAGRMQRDPSGYLTVPTRSDEALAPTGGEVALQLRAAVLATRKLRVATRELIWPTRPTP
jgi:phytoene desaturase